MSNEQELGEYRCSSQEIHTLEGPRSAWAAMDLIKKLPSGWDLISFSWEPTDPFTDEPNSTTRGVWTAVLRRFPDR